MLQARKCSFVHLGVVGELVLGLEGFALVHGELSQKRLVSSSYEDTGRVEEGHPMGLF